MDNDKQTSRELATKGLAVVGVVAVLLVGMWLAVAAVRFVPSVATALAAAFTSLSSVFVPAEHIQISVPSTTLEAEKPFTLSWDHTNKSADGSYVFNYLCAEGVYFTTGTSADSLTVYCNTPFHFVNSGNTLSLVPHTKNTTATDVTLALSFIPNGGTAATVESQLTVTVVKAITTTPNTTPSTGNTGSTGGALIPGTTQSNVYVLGGATSTVSNPNGITDLRVRILAVGVVDKVTGAFTATSSVRLNDRGAIKFEVENIGTRASGPWAFNAVLPTLPFYVFTSAQQLTLGAGDKIEYTLGFDSIEPQRVVTIQINIDPTAQTYDADRTNNTLRQQINVDI